MNRHIMLIELSVDFIESIIDALDALLNSRESFTNVLHVHVVSSLRQSAREVLLRGGRRLLGLRHLARLDLCRHQ